MFAVAGLMPHPAQGWSYEVRWGGARVLATVVGGRVELAGPDGESLTAVFPELADIGPAVAPSELMVDGEVVVVDSMGRPQPGPLAVRLRARGTEADRLAGTIPALYLASDLHWVDGQSLMDRPHRERRHPAGAQRVRWPALVGLAGL